MSWLHRALAALVPPPRREWIHAHYAELTQLEDRGERRRWLLGLLPVATAALLSQLRRQPGTFIGGALMKTIVATLSGLDLVAAAGLLVLWIRDTDQPWSLLVFAVVLVLQGGYTLAMLANVFGDSTQARQLLIVGATVSVIAGVAAFATGVIANLVAADHEYGPMTIALLIGAHGIASLLAFAGQRPAGHPNHAT